MDITAALPQLSAASGGAYPTAVGTKPKLFNVQAECAPQQLGIM
jgi:hypothetical protein